MKILLKSLIIVISSLAFYLLTGSGDLSLLLIILLSYFEFVYKKKERN